ncbi:ligand-binding sensor domain-containing protein [Chryseobacterium oryctis]|uniref:ATP-binding protein n=1 Tax=Chryseobacterium oryctis TaxID=2952618 RepID=A0ABT3HSV7_9FLAO|nr:two-component regulator propeller domain-containing protein [Chryseobacterium oryctis]MCW3162760.1 ATP-binding protein [Chryseobacterium oryctis]
MKFIFTILLIWFSQIATAQRYTSQWYTIENGLPQNSIKDIIKDKYGFLWLSTENGIVRYDGQSFTQYNEFAFNNFNFDNFTGSISKDSIFIRNNNEIDQILITKKTPKVFLLKKKEKTYHKIKNGYSKRLLKNAINAIYFDDTQYYIKLNSETYSFFNNHILYDNLKEKKKISFNFSIKKLQNIFVNRDILYITEPSERKIYKFHKGNIKVLSDSSIITSPDTRIYWQQITNQTFIVHDSKIYLLRFKGDKLELKYLIEYKDITTFSLNSIYYDENYNKLYLGSLNKGLNILQLSQFYVAKKNLPFADEVYYSSLPFSKNTIITYDGTEFDHNGIVKKYDFGNYNDKYYLAYDNSKNILLRNKSYSSIVRFSKNTSYKKTDSLSFNQSVFSFMESDGLYALALTDLSNCRFYIFNNDQFKEPICTFTFPSFINSFQHYNNDIYIVGSTSGLYSISINNKKIKKIDSRLNVRSIIQTKDKNIWVTTKTGFYLLRNEKLIKMPNDKDDYLNSAHYILEDSFGYFWISSNNGLFKVQKKQLLKFANDGKSDVNYYRFVKNDGFSTNEFNGSSIPNAFILDNGEFVFPSMDGFVFFKPNEIKTFYPDKNNIFIERVRINNGKIINFKNSLVLKNNYRKVEIFIDIPYYVNSDNLSIEAKIDELNDTWEPIPVADERKYTINRLDPGEYTLNLRILVSPNGDYVYKQTKFTIKPLYFQAMAFRVLSIVALLLLILAIIQLRTNFLRIKNKNLQEIIDNKSIELQETFQDLENMKKKLALEIDYQEKLIYSINHDITTPIKFITYLSQKATEITDPELQKKYYIGIYRSAEELYKFTSSIKEYIQLYRENNTYGKDLINVYDIIESKKMLFNEIAKQNETVIFNNVDQKLTSKINEIILGTIIHNLLDNAVKHTVNGKITINNNFSSRVTSIQIIDTGVGMSEEQIDFYNNLINDSEYSSFTLKKFGVGIYLVVYLIQKTDNNIYFSKNFPSGTIVTVDLRNY